MTNPLGLVLDTRLMTNCDESVAHRTATRPFRRIEACRAWWREACHEAVNPPYGVTLRCDRDGSGALAALVSAAALRSAAVDETPGRRPRDPAGGTGPRPRPAAARPAHCARLRPRSRRHQDRRH